MLLYSGKLNFNFNSVLATFEELCIGALTYATIPAVTLTAHLMFNAEYIFSI